MARAGSASIDATSSSTSAARFLRTAPSASAARFSRCDCSSDLLSFLVSPLVLHDVLRRWSFASVTSIVHFSVLSVRFAGRDGLLDSAFGVVFVSDFSPVCVFATAFAAL